MLSIAVYYIYNGIASGELMLVYKWEPAPFGVAMLTGFTAFWLASILTKPEDEERIDRFFDNMRRRSDLENLSEDGRKQLGWKSGHDLLLLDLPSWRKKERWTRFFNRYRVDLAGFLLSWVFVALLILLAWGILQL
jgi:hypothetical protein